MNQNRSLPNGFACLVLASLIFPSVIRAQQSDEEAVPWVCKDSETWNDCNDRVGSSDPDTTQVTDMVMAENSQRKKVAESRAQTVMSGLSATGNAAAKRTFLPTFLTSLGIDGLKDQNGTLAFTYNAKPNSFGHLSVEILAKPPEVFEQLKAKIPEDQRDSETSSLKDSLSDFDNLEGSLILNVTGGRQQHFGRILGDYDPGLGQELFELAEKEAPQRSAEQITIQLNTKFGERLTRKVLDTDGTFKEVQITRGTEKVRETKDRDPSLARELNQLVVEADAAVLATATRLLKVLDERRYFALADLAANQPQVYFTVKANQRDRVVGTNSWSFMGTWELPLGANINKLRKSCAGPMTFKCYTDYVEKAETTDSLKVKSRLKFEASGGEESAYDYSIPDLGVNLHIDRVRMLFITGTYGRSLRQDDTGKDLSRFDLEAKYEDVSGDEMRKNRLVATATLTQKFTDDVDFAISAVWANQPQYRGDVDKEWGARAGLRYKVDRKSQ